MAESIAASCGAPCYHTTHQEGHIAAALASLQQDWQERFLAFHLSGGTGEILLVTPHRNGYAIEKVGDSDLPPGQFVDRVGVALGLRFPAGPALEKLAQQSEVCDLRLNSSVKGMHISFSGPESAAQRAIQAGAAPAEVAAAVLDCIAKSLEKAMTNARRETGCHKVLLAGGVAANQRIRGRLQRPGVYFADARYAGDNATGVAALGARMWQQEVHHG